MVMDKRLSLSENITAVTRACRFFLFRRIHRFLTTYSTQLLFQAMVLSHLGYDYSLLAGLQASPIRHLQLIQNGATDLVLNVPRHPHVTPLLTDLHWLPVIAHIKYGKIWCLLSRQWCLHSRQLRDQPKFTSKSKYIYQTNIHVPDLSVPLLLFVLLPQWWNDLPADVITA